jgi:glycosyltransferase involved in cell wall biosynthesis
VLAASVVLVNSAYSRESLYRVYGVLAQICYLGVDAERFRPLPLPKSDYVLSVGALSPLKGFDFLLQSLAEIPSDRRPSLRLVSNAEDTTEKAYLENLADRLGVQVEFYTRIEDGQLVELYSQAMLTLYAPVMEPFGFVPLESMACGTPVVGVYEGGVRETIVDDLTGRFADRDPRCFARVVESLISDPALRLLLGQQARAEVTSRWSWERSFRKIEQYLALAAKRGVADS